MAINRGLIVVHLLTISKEPAIQGLLISKLCDYIYIKTLWIRTQLFQATGDVSKTFISIVNKEQSTEMPTPVKLSFNIQVL